MYVCLYVSIVLLYFYILISSASNGYKSVSINSIQFSSVGQRTCHLTVSVVDDVTLTATDDGYCDGAVNNSYSTSTNGSQHQITNSIETYVTLMPLARQNGVDVRTIDLFLLLFHSRTRTAYLYRCVWSGITGR